MKLYKSKAQKKKKRKKTKQIKKNPVAILYAISVALNSST